MYLRSNINRNTIIYSVRIKNKNVGKQYLSNTNANCPKNKRFTNIEKRYYLKMKRTF